MEPSPILKEANDEDESTMELDIVDHFLVDTLNCTNIDFKELALFHSCISKPMEPLENLLDSKSEARHVSSLDDVRRLFNGGQDANVEHQWKAYISSLENKKVFSEEQATEDGGYLGMTLNNSNIDMDDVAIGNTLQSSTNDEMKALLKEGADSTKRAA